MSDSIIVNVNPTSTDLVVINSNEEIINQVINVDEGSLSTNISINTEPNENVIISTDDVNVNENVNINQGGFVFSVNGKIGHIILTKDDFGLGNVDNTSDLWKPISYPTLSALALKADWSYVSQITSIQDVFYRKVVEGNTQCNDQATAKATPARRKLQLVGGAFLDSIFNVHRSALGIDGGIDAHAFGVEVVQGHDLPL